MTESKLVKITLNTLYNIISNATDAYQVEKALEIIENYNLLKEPYNPHN